MAKPDIIRDLHKAHTLLKGLSKRSDVDNGCIRVAVTALGGKTSDNMTLIPLFTLPHFNQLSLEQTGLLVAREIHIDTIDAGHVSALVNRPKLFARNNSFDEKQVAGVLISMSGNTKEPGHAFALIPKERFKGADQAKIGARIPVVDTNNQRSLCEMKTPGRISKAIDKALAEGRRVHAHVLLLPIGRGK